MNGKSFCISWFIADVCLFSAVCFCQTKGPTEIEFLQDLLHFKDLRNYVSSSTWDVEGYVVDRLAEIGPDATDMLIASLGREGFSVRSRAAEALSKMNDPEIIDMLKRHLNHPDAMIVSGVIRSFEWRGDLLSRQIVIGQIEKGHTATSSLKAEAWKQVKDSETIDRLIRLLKSNDWTKRVYAANALMHIKEARAADSLIQLLRDDGQRDIEALREELSQSGPEVIKWRSEYLKEEVIRCHYLAAMALGHIGNRKSLNVLAELLDDEEEQYRAIAVHALGVCAQPGATELLVSATNDKSIAVRLKALQLLGNRNTAASREALKLALNGQTADIRAVAIQSLAKLQSPSLMNTYMDIVKRQDAISIIPVIPALASCQDPQVIDILIEALKKHGSSIIGDACMDALKSKKNPEITKRFLDDLRSKDENLRARSAWALGMLEDPSAIASLRSSLRNDDNPFVRGAAAEALGHFKNPELIQDLLDAARRKDLWTNIGAVEALGNYEGKNVVDLLCDIVRKDENWDVRAMAADALGRIKDPAAVDSLIVAMGDQEDSVRKAAAISLGRINDPKAIDVLIRALDTEGRMVNGRQVGDGFICDSAAEALASMQDPDMENKLIRLFHSENYNGRIEAVRLLVRRGWIPQSMEEWIKFDIAAGLWDALPEKGSAPVEPLIAALKETNWNWVGGAAKALGKIKDERAIEPLIVVLKSDGWPRQEAAIALKGFGDARAVDPLIEALQAEDWHVRAAAAEALGEFETPAAREALKKASNDRHPRVKDAALKALAD